MRRYLASTFESLRYRNFRVFFLGQAISQTGTWMQKVAQAWLVLELTDSATLLGITAALQQLPTLLIGLWGGVLADRVDKRQLLLLTQSAAVVPALLLAVLTATGSVEHWMVLVLALVVGSLDAIDKPSRQAFPVEMVGTRHIANALTLTNVMNNSAKVLGPALAGIVIATVGLAASFAVNALSFGAVVFGLLLIRTDELERPVRSGASEVRLREGFQHIRRDPELLAPIALMAVSGLFAYEWTVTLPLLARETFEGDASVVGLMFTLMGAGAIVGGLALAATLQATTGRLVSSALVFAAVLLVTASSPSLPIAFGLLFVLGAASVAFRTVISALVQSRAAAEMRGRIVGVLVLASAGTTPIGAPLIGWVGETFGARTALAVGGIATAVAATVVLLYVRRHPLPTPVAPASPALSGL